MNAQPPVRSAHLAVRVEGAEPPEDTAHVRLFYPAAPTGSDEERLTGELPPDRRGAPLPVVVVVPAVNVGSDTYRWLAVELVRRGYAAVTYNHVGRLMPGHRGLSPGIDLRALGPGQLGTRPSASALGPVLEALAGLTAAGPMEGMLDLSRVVLGGHSAGGTLALANADPGWFPGVRAVFSYGSHTVPSRRPRPSAGHGAAGGPRPGADRGRRRRRGDQRVLGPLRRGGRRPAALAGARPRSTPACATGSRPTRWCWPAANHLLVCDPEDPTSARGFLEAPPTVDPAASRRAAGGGARGLPRPARRGRRAHGPDGHRRGLRAGRRRCGRRARARRRPPPAPAAPRIADPAVPHVTSGSVTLFRSAEQRQVPSTASGAVTGDPTPPDTRGRGQMAARPQVENAQNLGSARRRGRRAVPGGRGVQRVDHRAGRRRGVRRRRRRRAGGHRGHREDRVHRLLDTTTWPRP